MSEHAGAVTVKGNPKTLIGEQVQVGKAAPAFNLRKQDLSPLTNADLKGKVAILVTVPSLDTPTCDTETRRFNTEAAALGDIKIVVVSADLPMAQKRWCGAAGVDKVVTASDYYDLAFGPAFGLRIKELGLIARAIIVLDKEGVVRYYELVKEVANEPNYEAAIAAAKKLV
jgi:thiol peroxidase